MFQYPSITLDPLASLMILAHIDFIIADVNLVINHRLSCIVILLLQAHVL